jgi:hypothetical protein
MMCRCRWATKGESDFALYGIGKGYARRDSDSRRGETFKGAFLGDSAVCEGTGLEFAGRSSRSMS